MAPASGCVRLTAPHRPPPRPRWLARTLVLPWCRLLLPPLCFLWCSLAHAAALRPVQVTRAYASAACSRAGRRREPPALVAFSCGHAVPRAALAPRALWELGGVRGVAAGSFGGAAAAGAGAGETAAAEAAGGGLLRRPPAPLTASLLLAAYQQAEPPLACPTCVVASLTSAADSLVAGGGSTHAL